MATRPVWKGQLRLSLVAIPVEMYSATERSAHISFRQIHKPSGKRVRYQKAVTGVGPVESEDIWKGYEIDKDEYVLIDPAEIEEIKLESKKTFELVQFVDVSEIPPIYFDKPYFLSPRDELAEDAFRVVRDALKETGKAGIGQLAMRGREYLAAVRPCNTGLLLETLHYEDEIRKTEPFFASISDEKAEDDLLSVAKELIKRKTAPFDAAAFKDHYSEAIRALVDEKVGKRKKGTTRVKTGKETEGAGNVVDLMAALQKSVKSSGRKTKSKPTSGSKSGTGKKSA